jgi:osmotically-inducible protein OsmY
MRNLPGRVRLLGLGLLGLLPGCGGNDVEHLHQIGQKTVSKLQSASGGPSGRLVSSCNSLRGSLCESALDSRVAVRLAWDRSLAEAQIEVQTVSPGVVRLTGQVREPVQKQRAYDLAHSTTGVQQVLNEIGVGQ